jgi:DNA-binding NarL/FixJ family response regulator
VDVVCTHNASDPTTVLLVEPFALSRRGLRLLFDESSRFDVIADVEDPRDAPGAFSRSSPDLVVLGLGAESEGLRQAGLAALERIRARAAWVPIIVVVSDGSVEALAMAARFGVQGVVSREAPEEAILECASAVAGGHCALDPGVACAVLGYFHDAAEDGSEGARLEPPAPARLTTRERDVLTEIALGLRNKEIAEKLGLSVATVKTHVQQICRKLGVRDRTAALLATVTAGQTTAA